MTFVITPGCCSDASCISVCPVQCIRPRPGDPDFHSTEQLYIDPATCIDCQACMDECPIDAVHPDYDMPDAFGDLLKINADYFKDNPIVEAGPPRHVRVQLPKDRPSLRVAVVGSGPAACYAVSALTEIRGVEVSVFERLPTPFGLVRSGVAPDHNQTKRITELFRRTLAKKTVSCFFNVEVGVDVSIEEMLEHHHAVLWAAGADDDRKLGVPGEDLPGSYSAREMVAWYNGHPDHADRVFDLTGETVVMIGNGNVALDVARALTGSTEHFGRSDIADHALHVLANSGVKEVVIAARRGPEHAAYSTGELVALDRLEGVDVVAHADEISTQLDPDDRRDAVLIAAANRTGPESGRRIVFRYQLSPLSIDGDGRVQSITFARWDGETETIATPLILRAIGYRGRASAGLPFDDTTGTIPHEQGRIIDGTEPARGLYCSGWIKRGATGVIGTNKTDATETVASLIEDFVAGKLHEPSRGAEELSTLIGSRKSDVLDYEAWRRIDEEELGRGRAAGRSRVKFVSVDDMLAFTRAAASS
ncbi:FAD-dependent oxidoreductase [Rhodococcoides yunnanense]|uniref:FAD-dependent oxidoreductase n=1 Tax=Rhodococcoides yunnanense TaxID=278209 RepID=UPI0022B16808|nr:FAD-dependent oxidoreductase [Rhodococcus yunnanensis]MCZ4278479.1 FAD-dependent oxidoreductase [Rhodococcus yunnanensis]